VHELVHVPHEFPKLALLNIGVNIVVENPGQRT
jgi:hypothetical protein